MKNQRDEKIVALALTGVPQADLARQFHMTRERIRQIIALSGKEEEVLLARYHARKERQKIKIMHAVMTLREEGKQVNGQAVQRVAHIGRQTVRAIGVKRELYPCGTRAAYMRGCRCERCRAANCLWSFEAKDRVRAAKGLPPVRHRIATLERFKALGFTPRMAGGTE